MTKKSASKKPNSGFGTGHGSMIGDKDTTPGPGMYEVTKYRPQSANGVAFGKSTRDSKDYNGCNVGPGQYNLNVSKRSSIPTTMKFSHDSALKNDNPGPG